MFVIFLKYIVYTPIVRGVLFRLKIRELKKPHTATGGGPSPNIAEI